MIQSDRYKDLREIGRGAMGVVYVALDTLIGRTVALKTINIGMVEEGADRDSLRQRLLREAQSAGGLSHPGIVTVYDIGEYRESAYIVMEFVDGQNLEELCSSSTRITPDRVLSVFRQTASALDYAHSHGVIHRDIKPSNIMLSKEGQVKVTDFGIAKVSESKDLTRSGMMLGTPNFMSPEQARGLPVSGATDQFSLAVIGYRMLSGSLPFDGPSLTAILSKILWEEPDYKKAGLPEPVMAVFQRALAKVAGDRFDSVLGFVAALEMAYADSCEEGELNQESGEDSEVLAVEHPHDRTVLCLDNGESETHSGADPDSAVPETLLAAERGSVVEQPSKEEARTTLLEAVPSFGGLAGFRKRNSSGDKWHDRLFAKVRDLKTSLGMRNCGDKTKILRSRWVTSGIFVPLALAVAWMVYPTTGEVSTRIQDGHRSSVPGELAGADHPADQGGALQRQPLSIGGDSPPGEVEQTIKVNGDEPNVDSSRVRESLNGSLPGAVDQNESSDPAGGSGGFSAEGIGSSEAPYSSLQPEGQPKPTEPLPTRTFETPSSHSQTGEIFWSGQVKKNSILVIDNSGSSLGRATGLFPGTPVSVDVYPSDVVVRKAPCEANNWAQIVLLTGQKDLRQIRIIWKRLR